MATNVAEVRLGDLFVREGLIDAQQLQDALADAKESGTRVGFSLVKLGFVGENELTRMLSKQYRLPAVDLEKVEVDPKIFKLIDGDMAYKHLVLPLRRVGRTVAMANPSEVEAIDVLRFKTRYDIEPVIVGEFTLRKHLEKYYGVSEDQVDDLLGDFLEEDLEFVEEEDEEESLAALQVQVEDAPVVKFINGLLTDAVRKGVSDIHIEPYEKEIRVRYRLDGVLYEVMKPPMKMKAALVSRIKILSDLNIAEAQGPPGWAHQAPHEKEGGRLPCLDAPGDFRRERSCCVSWMRGTSRSISARSGSRPRPKRNSWGRSRTRTAWSWWTGPTGSGKTTTLYSALSQINDERVNIMTAEDPVEYNLHGINQVLVRNEIGMGFRGCTQGVPQAGPEHHHGR